MKSLNQGPRCNSKSCSGESVGQNGASLSGCAANHASFDPSAKQVPLELTGGKILFCSSDGRFFNKKGKELKPSYRPNAPSRKSGGWAKYKLMRHYGVELCHILVCATFHGPRPVDENGRVFECHHLNGNPIDNRAENLIFLSREDHRRFDAALKRGLILTHQSPEAAMLHDLTHHMEC